MNKMEIEMETMAARIVELEAGQAFQENIIEELNEALINQQRQLDSVEGDLQLIKDRLRQLLTASEN